MKPKFVTTAAVVIIGAGAFLAGRSSVSTDGTAASAESPQSGGRAGSSRVSGGSGSGSQGEKGKGEKGRTGSSSADLPATKEARLAKLETIMRGEDALARNRALLDYIDHLSPSELKDAVDRFRSMGITQERFGEYAMMLTAWAKADPLAALDYTKANTKGPFATGTILATWASSDPNAAIEWAKANHDPEKGENPYYASIIRTMAGSDPAAATGLLTSMNMSQERGMALDAILPHILQQGDAAARDWVASIQDDHLRDGAMTKVADQLAEKDPKGTADWVISNPGEAANRTIDDVLGTWLQKDAAGATAYYQALPAGEVRSNALRGIVNTMADDNPQSALAFMNSHPADITDRNVEQYAWHAMGSSPALAVASIGEMTNADARDGMYRRTIDNWMRTDETAARQYLQTTALPPSMQGWVQKRLSGGK